MEVSKKLEADEYAFHAGVNEAVARIHRLFLSQDHVLASVAGPAGNEVNVGKTRFSGAILKACAIKETPFVSVSGLDGVDQFIGPSVRMQKEIRGSEKCLILLKAMGSFGDEDFTRHGQYRETEEVLLRERAESFGLPFAKIDLRFLVYSPQRPICRGNRLSVDLVVRNELAKDKGI